MSDLVQVHHLEPMTTSETISVGVGLEHKSVIQLIRKHVEGLQKFGVIAFEMRLNPHGKPTEYAWLNEQQATTLITMMRNSPRVVEFKIALVEAFFSLRDRLRAQQEASAPPILSRDPAHVADLTVSGWRTFRALLGVGRSSGLTLRDSLRRANEATTRRIGINMLAEINAEDDLPPDPPDLAPELPSAARFFSDWCEGLTAYPVCPCDSAQLYAAYLRWCREADAIPCARNGLSAHIAAQKGWQIKVKRRYTDLGAARSQKSARMVLPPPIVLESASLSGADFRRSRFGDEAEWATAGYLAFASALEPAPLA